LRGEAPTAGSIASHDPPDARYDVGTADTSACVVPSDIRKNRDDDVLRPVNSRTRCAGASFLPGGNFCRSAIAPSGPFTAFGT
jgi:hypothetical protein